VQIVVDSPVGATTLVALLTYSKTLRCRILRGSLFSPAISYEIICSHAIWKLVRVC
jgi:hypothetical protein